MHGELSVEGTETVALLVREELARRRLSRQWLADEARVSLSTLEKALAGRRPFTLATVVRLEDALGTSLRGPAVQVQTGPSCSRRNRWARTPGPRCNGSRAPI